MKKILLSAVLCGFVLNDGYCFDEEHKITDEYFNKSICELLKERDDIHMVYYSYDFRNPIKLYDTRDELDMLFSLMVDISCRVCDNFKKFGTEFLESVIPSGNDKGKTVENLLGEHRLNNDHMQMICDDSVKYNVGDSGNSVTFELDGGEKIKISTSPYLTDDWDNEMREFCTFLYSKTYTTICTIEINVK